MDAFYHNHSYGGYAFSGIAGESVMNTLVLYPLLLMFIISGFSQVMAFSSIDLSYNSTLPVNPATGAQTTNETGTEFTQGTESAVFDINMTAGIVALIIALVVVGAVAGIHVLGSGLSDYSVQLIHKAAVYYGLWGVFSALSFIAFSSIPIFGLFLWLGLTLVYSLGFFQTLGGGGGEGE